MIYWNLIWAIVPFAIIAAVFIPMFTPVPHSIKDSESTEKLEQVIKGKED